MNLKCIIVEDEPLAIDVIEDFVRQVPFLELVAICKDALTAMHTLKSQPVDLMFLDLHLPKLKGLDFLQTLKHPPMVIITTAYKEYALKSYDYEVLDYLLKPVEFGRFMVAVQKALERSHALPGETSNPETATDLYFMVNKKKARVSLDSILYIESQKENICIVTKEKTLVTKYQISDLENELPAAQFIRVHRSFIVAKGKIDYVDAHDIEIQGKEIPIGRSYRAFVFKRLGI